MTTLEIHRTYENTFAVVLVTLAWDGTPTYEQLGEAHATEEAAEAAAGRATC